MYYYGNDGVDYCYLVIKDYKLISERPIGEYTKSRYYQKNQHRVLKQAKKRVNLYIQVLIIFFTIMTLGYKTLIMIMKKTLFAYQGMVIAKRIRYGLV